VIGPAQIAGLLLLIMQAPAAPDDPARTFLESEDLRARERARRILLGRREDALPVFERALEDDDPRVREAAIFALEDLPHEAIDGWLERALEDPDSAVQVAALRVLAARGPDVLPQKVLACADDRSWALRRAAALVLARTPDERAVPLLSRLADDPDPDVSEAALHGLLISPERRAAKFLIESYERSEPKRRVRILRRLLATIDPNDRDFFRRTLASEDDDHARILAAAGLARMGAPPLDAPHLALVLRAATSGDPELRAPAIATLLADRRRGAAVLQDALEHSEEFPAESLAELIVELLGPEAYSPLLAIARGDTTAGDNSRAAAIHALRRFKTVATNTDLLWIYAVELPRIVREELCAAFEDLPRSNAARSGLVDLLEDPDEKLRLRAFRVLLQYGAATALEIDWLWHRVLTEDAEDVQRRMCRLLATHASGEGAQRFAEQMVELLAQPEPLYGDAVAALSNLQDPELSRRVARLILSRLEEPLSFETLRLLTRLKGPEADERVAGELRPALARADRERALPLLIALRTAGGPHSLAAAREALTSGDDSLRLEALRTLLTRGDPAALDGLEHLYDELPGEQRIEFLERLEPGDAEHQALVLGRLLTRETDHVVLEAIVAKAGELGLPLSEELTALLTDQTTPAFLIRVAEALAGIGGPSAGATLRRLFQEACAQGGGPKEPLTTERQLLIESLARAVARTGQVDLAGEIAALFTWRVAELEVRLYESEAAFPFEATLMQALIDLAQSSAEPLAVAAAVEAELDRAARSGELYLLPKALFVQLARLLEKAPAAFSAVAVELLDLALLLPPRAGAHELWVATRLAGLAQGERDPARVVKRLERAQLLIRFYRVDGAKELRESLGDAAPIDGFDPLLRLDAEVERARARHCRLMATDAETLSFYRAAVDAAPFDSWLRLRIGAELMEQQLDLAGARREVRRAVELNPHDPDLQVRAARILAGAGDAAGFEAARAAHASLRDCGLARDTVTDRLGLAEGAVLLERTEEAREEIRAAIRVDPEARERVAINPLLNGLQVD